MNDGRATAAEPATAAIDIQGCKDDAAGAMRALVEFLPLALAVREIMRMRALAECGSLRLPLLDVGCGDGLFWEVITRELREGGRQRLSGLMGIDVNQAEVALASMRLSPIGGEVRALDISDPHVDLRTRFNTIICNCSLEHVPELEPALNNIRQYLDPQGELFMVLPAPRWTDTLATKRVLSRLSRRAAQMYAGLFDGFYQHHHLYPAWTWEHLLRSLGFEVEIRGIGSRLANHLTELWYLPAVGSFLYKGLFKRYPAALTAPLKARYLRRLGPFFREVEQGAVLHDDLRHPEIIEWFVRARPR
jgi:2-polyprenyl-3-methyl-5-hydroxy-6-metoxy-1,4-benzoquinol methylase